MSNNPMRPGSDAEQLSVAFSTEKEPAIKRGPFRPEELVEVYGNPNPAPGEAPAHVSAELFAKTALADFDAADLDKDGYLDPNELEEASVTGNQLHNSVFGVMKDSLAILKDLSNDEWGAETSISKADLQEFDKLRKNNGNDRAVQTVSEVLKDFDARNALKRMHDELGEGKTLTENNMNEALQAIEGSPQAKDLAAQMKSALIKNDVDAFKEIFAKSHEDPHFDESVKILNRAFRFNSSDLSVARTSENSLVLFHRRVANELRVDPGLVVSTDGSMIVKPVYSDSKFSVLQNGEVLDHSPQKAFDGYSSSLDRLMLVRFNIQDQLVYDVLRGRQRRRLLADRPH